MLRPDGDERGDMLRAVGASESEIDELIAYATSAFDADEVMASRHYPLADEPFIEAWSAYAEEAARDGVGRTLRRHLVQLRFPIASGMSARDDYRAATRRGLLPPNDHDAAPFATEAGLSLLLHPTPAGRLPVVIAESRADFEFLVRALARRNEPDTIPPSMGACIIGGYNDWTRIARLRAAWTARNPAVASAPGGDVAWSAELTSIMPQKDLYQDRFVVLGTSPYSGIPASALRLDEAEWRRLSLVIRLEHECAHYFTRRVFGSMQNSLLDELIADYTGIVAARGRFEPDWLLRFMGVEHGDHWRPDGRLINYRGTPPLSDGAFVVLQTLVRRAAVTLDRFDAIIRDGAPARIRTLDETAGAISAMAAVGLEALAQPNAELLLHAAYCGATQGVAVHA